MRHLGCFRDADMGGGERVWSNKHHDHQHHSLTSREKTSLLFNTNQRLSSASLCSLEIVIIIMKSLFLPQL